MSLWKTGAVGILTLFLTSCLGPRPTTPGSDGEDAGAMGGQSFDAGATGGRLGTGGGGGRVDAGADSGGAGTGGAAGAVMVDGGATGGRAGGGVGGSPDGGRDASADAPQCIAGGSCPISDCQAGTWACTDGGLVCRATSQSSPGTPCGAADAGASVCNASGQCTACNAGGDCTLPAAPCLKRAYDCSTGVAVCQPAGNARDGDTCGAGLYCSGGVCGACKTGTTCSPSGNPCHAGLVTACTNGVATCTDQSTPVSAGTPCTQGAITGVCSSAGVCTSCSVGTQCNPGGNVCQVGTQSCSMGPICGSPANAREGQTCGTNQICHAGACVACNATSCSAGCCNSTGCVTTAQTITVCGNGTAGASCMTCPGPGAGTGSATCSNNACGFSCSGATPNACSATQTCVSFQTDSNNCGLCGKVCSPGTRCTGGQCVCNTTTGCPGCCSSANACLTGQTVTSCGAGGNVCSVCPTGASCNATTMGGICSCPAGQILCGAACADTAGDGANCGRCGHSCQGGGCITGKCQPIQLATATQPGGLAIDAQFVYWTNNARGGSSSSVLKVPLGGGQTLTVASNLTPGLSLGRIAVDRTSAYWADGPQGAIVKAPIGGGAATALVSVNADGGFPTKLAIDSSFVYWVDSNLFQVTRTPIAAGGVSVVLAQGLGNPFDIVVSGARVYFTNNLSSGTLQSASTATPTSFPPPQPTTLASGENSPRGIALDTSNVYWVTSDFSVAPAVGSVLAIPVAGGSVVTLSAGRSPVGGLASDGTTVYWADWPNVATGGATIMSIPVTGGTAVPVATGQFGPDSVAVDATAIYWTDTQSGAILKVAK